jgi:hypothetical protein
MRPVQPERVEQPDPVVRHVLNSVGRRGEVTAHHRTQVRRWRVVQVRGQPYVTVVVTHHEEVRGGQRRAQLGMPDQHLGAQTRHKQQRAAARCTERLVSDLNAVAGNSKGLHPYFLQDHSGELHPCFLQDCDPTARTAGRHQYGRHRSKSLRQPSQCKSTWGRYAAFKNP